MDTAGAGDAGRPDNGKVTDGVYRNDFFGFSYTVPEGWMVHGEETQKVMMETGKDLVAGDDTTKRRMLDTASKRTYQLLTVFEYPFGTPGKPNRGIQMIAENVAFAPGIQSGKDYILTVDHNLSSSQVQVQPDDEPVEQQISGVSFYHQTLSIKIGDKVVYEIIYSTVLRRHVVSFILTAQTKEGAEEVAKSLASFRQTASEPEP